MVYRKCISPLALGEHKAVLGTASAGALDARTYNTGRRSGSSGRGSHSYDARPHKWARAMAVCEAGVSSEIKESWEWKTVLYYHHTGSEVKVALCSVLQSNGIR